MQGWPHSIFSLNLAYLNRFKSLCSLFLGACSFNEDSSDHLGDEADAHNLFDSVALNETTNKRIKHELHKNVQVAHVV